MKKVLLFSLIIMSCSLCSCNNKDNNSNIAAKETDKAEVASTQTESTVTDFPDETFTANASEDIIEATATPEATEQPVQKEGTISIDEATSLLRTFLGSYDDNGNEFSFGYENTITKDGVEYYNFRVTTLIFSESGTVHQSYFGNYIVSTDGIEVEEYFMN